MSFLCDNQRLQKIIFEYKARPLMARVRYLILNFAPKTHHSLQQTKSDHERTEYCSSAVKASGGLSLSAAARARCVVVFVEAALAKLLLSRLFYFYSLLPS